MVEIAEIGTVSARGQVAIPSGIRQKMGLKEGEKLLFLLEGDSLLLKKVQNLSWSQITKPLKQAAKEAKLDESNVVDLVHRARKKP